MACSTSTASKDHRDLKPQNILMAVANRSAPVPKITDFGLSRDEDKDLTMTSVGTPYYVAPEIIRGERYSAYADIFSLGILMNQIDTLQDPSTGVNFALMNARRPGSFRPLHRVGVPEQILTCCEPAQSMTMVPRTGRREI